MSAIDVDGGGTEVDLGLTIAQVIVPLEGEALDSATSALVDDPASEVALSLKAAFATRATAATLAVVRKMRAGVDSLNIGIMGDSTANEPTEWFQLAMAALGARFPTYNVTSRLWNDATQVFDAATTIQTGIGGARNLYATLSNGAKIATPDAAAVQVTGDLEVHVHVAVDDWTPGSAMDLCGKSAGAPLAGWFLRLNTNGTLTLFWSTTGSDVPNATSTVAVPFADGADGWVRFTLDVDNGASGRTITFYTGTDGVAWTQLGASIVQGTVTSVYPSPGTALSFIGRNGGGLGFGGMAAYRMRVYNSLAGSLVADCNVEDMPTSTTPFVDSKGNVWTPGTVATGASGFLRGAPTLALWNASTSGKAIAYSNDATRFPRQTPQPFSDLMFINYGHNEGSVSAGAYRASYKQLADALLAKYPDMGIVAVAQNPELSPIVADLIRSHASRMSAIRSLAASQIYGLVDLFDTFLIAPNLADLINADGIHPTPLGSALAAAEVGHLFAA